MHKHQILVVDDSPDIQDLVTLLLKSIAEVTCVSSMEKAIDVVRQRKFDLFLMDVMLDNGGDGFTLTPLLREIPNGKDVPVIFLTSKSHIRDKVMGFQLGAEDYIVKPFDLIEFRIRVENRLQKILSAKAIAPSANSLMRGNIKLELSLQKAFLVKENKPISLTPLQFKILFFLMSKEGQVVSREELSTNIWGEGSQAGRTVDTHVNSLRKKLAPHSEYIQSVYGSGYSFQPS